MNARALGTSLVALSLAVPAAGHAQAQEELLRLLEPKPPEPAAAPPSRGIALELCGGGMWIGTTAGGSGTEGAFGLSALAHPGRWLPGESQYLREGVVVELGYLHAGRQAGTDGSLLAGKADPAMAVRVGSGYHFLSLAILAGYPFEQGLLYAKVGPAVVAQTSELQIQGTSEHRTGLLPSVVYGVGVRSWMPVLDGVAVSGGLEVSRYRRAGLDDTALLLGAGIAF